MANTTKIVIYNINTKYIIVCSNKEGVAQYFNEKYNNVVNWFRESRIIDKMYNNERYLIMKVDKYIKKQSFH